MPPFPTWLWWSLKVRTFWQETQQFCDNERLNETVTCDKTGEEHLWSSHQSAGWWPLWGRGEASGNRRCWWSRSGCVYARSAAPRAGSLRSAPQTPPHVSSCRRALVWFTLYIDCLKLHVFWWHIQHHSRRDRNESELTFSRFSRNFMPPSCP